MGSISNLVTVGISLKVSWYKYLIIIFTFSQLSRINTVQIPKTISYRLNEGVRRTSRYGETFKWAKISKQSRVGGVISSWLIWYSWKLFQLSSRKLSAPKIKKIWGKNDVFYLSQNLIDPVSERGDGSEDPRNFRHGAIGSKGNNSQELWAKGNRPTLVALTSTLSSGMCTEHVLVQSAAILQVARRVVGQLKSATSEVSGYWAPNWRRAVSADY